MRRSISSPRVVLAALGAAVLLWGIGGAYVECPRVQLGFGGVGGTVSVPQDKFPDVVVRSSRFREALEKRLSSPQFLKNLAMENPRLPSKFWEKTAVTARHAPPASLETEPMVVALSTTVSEAYQRQALAFLLGESEQADLYVLYLFPQSYTVRRPTNSWILWFQSWLPGIARREELTAEADAANQALKTALENTVQRCVEDCATSCQQ